MKSSPPMTASSITEGALLTSVEVDEAAGTPADAAEAAAVRLEADVEAFGARARRPSPRRTGIACRRGALQPAPPRPSSSPRPARPTAASTCGPGSSRRRTSAWAAPTRAARRGRRRPAAPAPRALHARRPHRRRPGAARTAQHRRPLARRGLRRGSPNPLPSGRRWRPGSSPATSPSTRRCSRSSKRRRRSRCSHRLAAEAPTALERTIAGRAARRAVGTIRPDHPNRCSSPNSRPPPTAWRSPCASARSRAAWPSRRTRASQQVGIAFGIAYQLADDELGLFGAAEVDRQVGALGRAAGQAHRAVRLAYHGPTPRVVPARRHARRPAATEADAAASATS